MSTIRILSCSANYLVRTSLNQTHKQITGFLPTGVSTLNKNFSSTCNPISCNLRFLTAKPSTSVYDLTKYSRDSFSTNAPGAPDKRKPDTQLDQKSFHTNVDDLIFGNSSKLSQLEKFKLMYKKYWYVLIPVHVATSISWIVGFYYLSKSGVDLPAMLQYIHLSETIIEKVKNSDMGHYAIAYLCYKVITPFRYGVSLGITTLSIKRLVFAGYIKPIPTKKELIQMYEQKKAIRAKRKEDEAKAP